MPPLCAEGALVVASACSLDECVWGSFACHDGEVVFGHVFFDEVVAWKRQVLQVCNQGSWRVMYDRCAVPIGDAYNVLETCTALVALLPIQLKSVRPHYG